MSNSTALVWSTGGVFRCLGVERPGSWMVLLTISLLCALGAVGAAEPGADTKPAKDPPAEGTKKDAGETKDDAPSAAAKLETYKKELAAGKAAFSKRDFAEALVHFREASKQVPENHYAALLAGIAAYWNHEPRVALEFWVPLAAEAQKNSPEEWEITRHLVLAWHAMHDDARAQECVNRLYALRSQARLPQALSAKGFTRQHLFLGKRRLGIWEVFDERGGLPSVWEYHAVQDGEQGEEELANLALELEPRSDGKPGYALVENADRKRIYKRWPTKPTYVEARDTAVAAIKGQLKFLDAGSDVSATAQSPDGVKPDPVSTPEPKAETKPGVQPEKKPGVASVPEKPELSATEKARTEKIAALKLSPAASRILAVAARLADVDFDVSRYVRLSVSDPAAARALEAEQLTRRFPQATSDASDLVQYIAAAKPADCAEAFKHVDAVVTGAKADYARYVLLTALNTRGGEPPVEYLSSCLGSADFVVRGTAALLLARAGRKEGLEGLFKEVASAGPDGPGADEVARIVSFYLEELVGPVLGPCPPRDAGPWREAALVWWKQQGPKLGFVKGSPAGQPPWRPAK